MSYIAQVPTSSLQKGKIDRFALLLCFAVGVESGRKRTLEMCAFMICEGPQAPGSAQSGVPLLLVSKALNHNDIRSTEIYARFSNADVRQALEAHSTKLSPYVNGMHVDLSDAHQDLTQIQQKEAVIPETVPEPSIPSLAKAIDQCALHLKVFFWLYFMTGLTKDQLLKAKWKDLDVVTRELSVMNRYKRQKKQHYLSAQAIALVTSLPRHSAYIFASPRKPRPVSLETIKGAWTSICRRARLPGFEVKTLQRTAMKLAESDGLQSDLVALP